MENLENLVTTSNGKNVTTSLKVAEVFGKRHADVLRDVGNLSCSEEFRERNFALSSYTTAQNKSMPMFEMTKDGFSFLVMGYTGEPAGSFKEAFIKEFNNREAMLTNDDFIVSKAIAILSERTKALEIENHTKSLELEKASEVIKEQAPKVQFHDQVLNSKGVMPVTIIAKELGMTAIALNELLVRLKIQYKVNGTFVLTAKYQRNGYTKMRSFTHLNSQGEEVTVNTLYWTEKGRKFIHEQAEKQQAHA